MIRLALYQPEIPHNTGTLLRLGSCLGMGVDIIEPCGFIWNHPSLKRSSMDYLHHVDYERFDCFDDFRAKRKNHRIVAVTPTGTTSFYDFSFQHNDILLMGRESDGLPASLEKEFDSVYIPMKPGMRSLNLAISAAMVITEAQRQTKLP